MVHDLGLYGQFCNLIAIQILLDISSWYYAACTFTARMVEYIWAFRYILNK